MEMDKEAIHNGPNGDKSSSEVPQPAVPDIQMSRSYQLEMYQKSMQQNIIITMDTGSGKTHIAKLRIEAELKRQPTKRIWFLTPTVVLAQQQCAFFSSQLPTYVSVVVTGDDFAELWSAEMWDTILKDTSIIVSTPAVLKDALHHAYVRLEEVSLLVFDEAHHCGKNHPMATIMRLFYHPLKDSGQAYPAILGLTASPATTAKSKQIDDLEILMDAICQAPLRSLDEFRRFVYLPKFVTVNYAETFQAVPLAIATLQNIVQDLRFQEDPHYQSLLQMDEIEARVKVKEIEKKQYTPSMKQLRSLSGHTAHILEQVGSWAALLFLKRCISKLHDSVIRNETLIRSGNTRDQRFIDETLSPVRVLLNESENHDYLDIAPKTAALLRFLQQDLRPQQATVIFVERRSTAFALCKLLQEVPDLSNYSVFSCVGLASSRSRDLTELVELPEQKKAFASFRKGEKDICVATQVVEEGVDIPAINLVVRFDDPKTFKSYVQSRGRARQPDSKFVMLRKQDDHSRQREWDELEKQIKEQYMGDQRELRRLEAIEAEDEAGAEFFEIEASHALLTYPESVSHLYHFCATLSRPANPVLLLEGEMGFNMHATVILPSSLAPSLQVIPGSKCWNTEKMARRDACFQACKKLYYAGLLDDHFQPKNKVKRMDQKLQESQATCNIPYQVNPWCLMDPNMPKIFAHRISIHSNKGEYVSTMLLLPVKLEHTLHFEVSGFCRQDLQISLFPTAQQVESTGDLAQSFSDMLFTTTFRRRLEELNDGGPKLPFNLIPLLEPQKVRQLLESHEVSKDALSYAKHIAIQPIMTWIDGKVRPRLWYIQKKCESIDLKSSTSISAVSGIRLFLQRIVAQDSMKRESGEGLTLANYSFGSATALYGPIAVLLPSILCMVEAGLRAQMALRSSLQGLKFTDSGSLVHALIAKSASDLNNYERLEFLGDGLLKYFAVVQCFFSFPLDPQGHLSAKVENLVSNARLQQSTRELGLDKFVTTDISSGRSGKLPSYQKLSPETISASTRTVSSKLLADVVESVFAAAWLDGEATEQADAQIVDALNLFLPEMKWRLPRSLVQEYDQASFELQHDTSRFEKTVTGLVGYTFKNPALLIEAMIHVSEQPRIQSYDRLEFLGDAILDRIVKVKVFDAKPALSPERMTLCRHALVSRYMLSFLVLNASTTMIEVAVDLEDTLKPKPRQEVKISRLSDWIQGLARTEERKAVDERFELYQERILAAIQDGKFPFTLLSMIKAPKAYCDIFESLLAAIFIDTGGSIDACEEFIERMGLLDILNRLISDESMELRPPAAYLRILAVDAKITYSHDAEGIWSGRVEIGEDVLATVTGALSGIEAECRVSEAAIEKLKRGSELPFRPKEEEL